MKKIHYALIAIALVVGVVVIKKTRQAQSGTAPLYYTVEKGNLEFLVYATGNLEAEQSTNVDAPSSVFDRDLRIWEIPITDLVEEGTLVDSGEYVATLDQNMIQEKLIAADEEMELAYNSLVNSRLDSNLTLNNKRDAIITAVEAVEEKDLYLAESKYESPATIQKAKMDREKALRKLAQEKQSYELQKRKSRTQVMQKEIDYKRKKKRVNKLRDVLQDIVIVAPQKGMVIYLNTRGEKRTVGSMVSSHSPTIATLPDMSTMISVAYVNEIDVSQLKVDQAVNLTVDAFPGKHLKGNVISIANIGRNISGSDAKVFKVNIKVLSRDSSLRPAMTTNNVINTASYSDTLYIPTETIFSDDTLSWVYNTNKKTYKQIVRVGSQNESYSIIVEGIKEGDRLLWNHPEEAEQLEIKGIDIYQREKATKLKKEKLAQEEAEKMLEEKSKVKRAKKGNSSDGMIIIR
jgi:HlyD family secretion protein